MSEADQNDKEYQRQQLSRVASGWIKLSKFTLDKYATASGATRSNMFSQVSDPDGSKRMSVEALVYSAGIAGIRVDSNGMWWLYDRRAQTWYWDELKETGKEAVVRLFQILKNECGSPRPFRVTRMPLIENSIFRMKREHCLVEIEDRQGNELAAVLVTDNLEQQDEAIATLLGTNLFEEMPSKTITPEFAMQVVNGACPKPPEQPDFVGFDWNSWMALIAACEMRGTKPQDLAKVLQIELPSPKNTPQQTGFKTTPTPGTESWNH